MSEIRFWKGRVEGSGSWLEWFHLRKIETKTVDVPGRQLPTHQFRVGADKKIGQREGRSGASSTLAARAEIIPRKPVRRSGRQRREGRE